MTYNWINNISTKYWEITILKEEWTVYKNWEWYSKKVTKVRARCHCWNEWIAKLTDLKRWKLQSCWCSSKKRKNFFRNSNYKHWMSHTNFERIFQWLKARCNNKKHKSYPNYWWRWIKYLWNSFEEFKNDMYESYLQHIKEYWKKDTSIDRIDVNWNYCKENCRWATNIEQANNKNRNVYITYNWKTQTMMQWCKELWISYYMVRGRIQNWWNKIDAILTPKQR